MGKSLTHVLIIKNNMKTQALMLPLESLLNKVVSSSMMPTVKPVVTKKIVSVPTRTCRKKDVSLEGNKLCANERVSFVHQRSFGTTE
jgi:hypothetical protein